MNKYASLALAFLLVFSGCLGGSDNDLTTEDNTVEPVGETDFTSLEKDLENLTNMINAEIARLDNLETLVEGIDDSEDTLEALGCEEDEIAAYDGMEWSCAHVQQFLPPLDEAVWGIVSSEFDFVKYELEEAKNITNLMWDEIDYIQERMQNNSHEIYLDMENMSDRFATDLDEIYEVLFVKPILKIGIFFWKKGDENTIDRFGPNGIAKIIKNISNKAVQFQSGYIYDYAFVMLIGLSALITYLILT